MACNLNHAVTKHGRNGSMVQDMLYKGKCIMKFSEGLPYRRTAKLCFIEKDQWGVGIFNASGYMLTAYIMRYSLDNVREIFTKKGWKEGDYNENV